MSFNEFGEAGFELHNAVTAAGGVYSPPARLSHLCTQCQMVFEHFGKKDNEHTVYQPTEFRASEKCDSCSIIFNQSERKDNSTVQSVSFYKDSKMDHRFLTYVFLPSKQYITFILIPLALGGFSCEYSVARTLERIEDPEAPWRLAKAWLDLCRRSHDCTKSKEYRHPTRLLRICSSGGQTYLQLSTPTYSQPGLEYCTLSHCWGNAPMATLQRGNLEQFTESIALCGLSKTFQDAVQTAQRLGLQYIWIDSLCIIQDDNDDWQRESSTMSKVYAGSTLNIAAAAAEDGRIGCFFQRNQRTIQRIRPCVVQVPSQGAQDAMYAFQNPFHWLKEVDQSPLAKRAWVLQERFLAPRTLYFGASQVYWECSRLVACESFPFGMENTVAGNQSFTFNAARANCFEDREDQEQDETYWNELSAFWHTIVRCYSRARLTKEGDKLVAISGIARFCQSRTGDQYVAGLWKNHLHAHLLWSIKRWVEPSGVSAVTTAKENIAAVTTAKKYIAPSWSWASANRAVKFHGLEGRSMISVLDIHLEPLGHDPLGQLKAASLRIQCSLLRAPVLPLTRGTDDFHSVISVVHDYRFKFDADLPDNMNHVYMMMVEHSTRYSYQRTLRGLLISATGNQQGQYRRVGYFELQHLLKATVTMFEVVNGLPGLETEEAYEAIADPDKHGNQYVIMLV